jgi:hypothetical protein
VAVSSALLQAAAPQAVVLPESPQQASPVPQWRVVPQSSAAKSERVEVGVEIGRERPKSKVRSQYNYRR